MPGITPPEEARRHLEHVAYLNSALAQFKLRHAYEFMTPLFPFDALLSVQYYEPASRQGEIEADKFGKCRTYTSQMAPRSER